MKLAINGIRYHIKKHQKGVNKPDFLLLHGFMGSGQNFKDALPLLTKFANPVTIDLLGHGETEGADSPERFAVEQQVADLKSLIREIFETPPFLHGYSMGGRLALRYALAYPQTIRGLIIESANYGLEAQNLIKDRKQIDEERAQAIEADFSSFVEEWQTLSIFNSGQPEPKKAAKFYESIQEQQNPKQMANSLRGFGTASMESVKAELSTLNLPVLILAGEGDSKYKEIGCEMHELFRQSTLNIIPNAGHRVHRDQPDAFVMAVKNFMMTIIGRQTG
jgi:2-succinyl-6-hydroxy-2,4-cyclohexadiene-1-carboxylate synthase